MCPAELPGTAFLTLPSAPVIAAAHIALSLRAARRQQARTGLPAGPDRIASTPGPDCQHAWTGAPAGRLMVTLGQIVMKL
jgi:hypothetical protein